MSASSIALNRFGLGARPGDAIVGDPAKWVMAQCERFEAQPSVIASAPATAGISTGLVAYYAQEKAIRAQFGPRTPKAAIGLDGKPAVAAPTMSGAMSPATVSPGVAPPAWLRPPWRRRRSIQARPHDRKRDKSSASRAATIMARRSRRGRWRR
ncbi:hypothetical protein NHF48_019260 [Sphingomonas sp. H160509]|uniref:hypothetical protein n=1 Tax=Sphingomonas sp. H160509 TaxID=2955313 RepID=UPI0020975F7E|nr:hypothetical protein [Sphingomonas sp. H160509]